MATSNSPTCGHSNSPRQDGSDYGSQATSVLCLAGVNFLGRPATTILAGGGGEGLTSVLRCIGLVLISLSNGCLASEARQAVGIGRGAVGKPRTPRGPSTGLSCGRVACPRRARVA